MELSRTQIDKLGDRLIRGANKEDIEIYFQLRDAYAPALENIEERLRRILPTTPPASRLKTIDSVINKLQRKAARRLSTMQDIAGCRVVVTDISMQNVAIELVKKEFGQVLLEDFRWVCVSDYRAVHIIIDTYLAKQVKGQVEIQIRTSLQDIWAQLSEKLSDLHGNGAKYSTDKGDKKLLAEIANFCHELEIEERQALPQSDAATFNSLSFKHKLSASSYLQQKARLKKILTDFIADLA